MAIEHGSEKQVGRAETGAPLGRTYNKWAILVTVLVMTFMVCLDSSIVTVALPVMQKELGAGDEIQWVSSIYLVATCIALLPFGRLGDKLGKVYVFQAGVVGFTLGSLLCGLSSSLPMLVVARAVQGVGCALAMANNMGIITEAFPARERGRAMGFLSTAVALGMMAGPVFGGIIVSSWVWEGIFLINVPVGVVSFLVGLRTLPHVHPMRDGHRAGLSMLGSARLCFFRQGKNTTSVRRISKENFGRRSEKPPPHSCETRSTRSYFFGFERKRTRAAFHNGRIRKRLFPFSSVRL